jgi:4-hydroxybenzoyl-CoA thioesterase/acyl-CoA thioester hydrolase
MTEFCLPIRVYIEDTDAGGIVYHANYLKFMERARTEFMRDLGYFKPALFDGLQLVVHELQIKYVQPAKLDDELKVTAVLEQIGKASFKMQQLIYRNDDLLVASEVKVVCLNASSKKPAAMPVTMFEKLSGLLR